MGLSRQRLRFVRLTDNTQPGFPKAALSGRPVTSLHISLLPDAKIERTVLHQGLQQSGYITSSSKLGRSVPSPPILSKILQPRTSERSGCAK